MCIFFLHGETGAFIESCVCKRFDESFLNVLLDINKVTLTFI